MRTVPLISLLACSLVLLLGSTANAHAAPILYNIGSAIVSLAIAVPGGTTMLGLLFPSGAGAAAVGRLLGRP